MALLPIAWDINSGVQLIRNTYKLKPIFDYPAAKDLGQVFGTSFTLKLYLGKDGKRNWKTSTKKTICVEIERFCDLSVGLSIQGSISLHEANTYKRIALKAFRHSFTDGEKSFVFQLNMSLCGQSAIRLFSNLNVHGHICVDNSNHKDVKTDTEHSMGEPDVLCTIPEVHKSYSLLSNDFEHMLHDQSFTDVILNCAGEQFSAHRGVLSSRSPVFRAMFESDMKESHTDEIPISDVEPAALRALLNYIYCGKIDDLSDGLACDLLYAADKYDLPVVKENCISYLKTALSLDNVCRIMNSAILHDESLKAIVFNYVVKHSQAILCKDEWKTLEEAQPHIYREILLSLSQKKSSKEGTAVQ